MVALLAAVTAASAHVAASPWSFGPDVSSRTPVVSTPDPATVDASHRHQERRYRVNGKIRLLLFWAGRENVGGARLRWDATDETSTLALLAGSNPDRAPKGLNQWIYLREENRADDASIFALRSMTDAESAADPADAILDGPQFGASCTAVTPAAVRSAVTTVTATPGLTYAMFGRVLDELASAPKWTAKRMARPAGTEIGFLTALERLLMTVPELEGADRRPTASAAYIYNSVPYDLVLERVETLGGTATPVNVDGRPFERLRTAGLLVRNRATHRTSRFSVTYEPGAAVGDVILPVSIVYQPNWWLKVELRLDDGADLPQGAHAETPGASARVSPFKHLK